MNFATALDVVDLVCKEYGVSYSDIISKRRPNVVAEARAAIVFILRTYGATISDIAFLIKKSRSTTLYYYNRPMTDKQFSATLTAISTILDLDFLV